MDMLLHATVLGITATLVMDLWAMGQKRLFNIPSLNYRLVGRWIGHMPRGKWVHHTIVQARPVKGEALMGWGAHYLIGIVFTWLFLMIMGSGWLEQPTFLPALAMGIISVVAPFFLMQPGFGFGFAAAKTPQPNVARQRSLIAHASFGIGIYVGALLLRQVWF
ncbi:hypothetical protein FHU10_1744 [Serratia fonticola]|jgi:hypothetical protein|uniref:DUF2938 domain-containing protein n=1 Tax=Serratia fonticola TaxID=47917 RepID=A0A542CVC8_SERFO|nr:DUF2938 domain-containing protein [Serratia fonticola]TQI78252.1 hypothetical protein FHU09_0707 [Serratia fonticola]TQI94750.1 DUF2938 family protein [Serratia fonticola]TVZ69248.1 hypothetical protein FHU10_1744 [Serratia fonticola]